MNEKNESKLNRRHIMRGLVAAAALPAVPALAAKDTETVKREVVRGLLDVSDQEATEITLLRIAMNKDHYCRPYALELLDSGMPVCEVQQRVEARVHYNLYGPKGAPVYDKQGNKIGGGYLGWRDD